MIQVAPGPLTFGRMGPGDGGGAVRPERHVRQLQKETRYDFSRAQVE